MLIKLAKIVKKSFRNLGERGYTLVEIAAVVAVTATLAAVVVPVAMDKIEKSKEARAADDVKALASAVAGFFGDTGVWPARDANTPCGNHLYVLRTGNSTSNDPEDPDDKWPDYSGHDDFAQNHLVKNTPGGSTTCKYDNWAGPYAESLKDEDKRDPWGHNYLIWVKGMWDETDGHYGWIISAGPDGNLDTAPTDDELKDDDIGTAIYRASSS